MKKRMDHLKQNNNILTRPTKKELDRVTKIVMKRYAQALKNLAKR